jgi:hypothetical protein
MEQEDTIAPPQSRSRVAPSPVMDEANEDDDLNFFRKLAS